MKATRQRLTRLLTAIPTVVLAWWLFEAAVGWSGAMSLSQFFLFTFCLLGIDRVVRAAVDLVTIALAPADTLKRHQ
jgi:hypothetical protein